MEEKKFFSVTEISGILKEDKARVDHSISEIRLLNPAWFSIQKGYGSEPFYISRKSGSDTDINDWLKNGGYTQKFNSLERTLETSVSGTKQQEFIVPNWDSGPSVTSASEALDLSRKAIAESQAAREMASASLKLSKRMVWVAILAAGISAILTWLIARFLGG